MKNKSFLSKFEELKPKVPIHLDMERKLLPRLKFMGYVMLVFCLAAFIFAFSFKEETEIIGPPPQEGFTDPDQTEAVSKIELISEDGQLELNPTEVLNFYLVSFIFAVIGTTCFLIAWKKKKKLFQEPQTNKE
jgi:ABC-type glycerol-3-phosphate transport system permease component